MPSMSVGTTFSRATAPTMPHIALSFPRPFPAVARHLRLLVERKRAGGHVLPNGGARADRRAAADRHRRDELGIGADVHVVFDNCAMLFRTVVVADDRSGADVDVGPHRRVSHIREMVRLAAGADRAGFHFDEVADM